jgi:hypothetical protein
LAGASARAATTASGPNSSRLIREPSFSSMRPACSCEIELPGTSGADARVAVVVSGQPLQELLLDARREGAGGEIKQDVERGKARPRGRGSRGTPCYT